VVKIISLYLILFVVLYSASAQSVYKSFSRLSKKDLYSAQIGFDKKLKRYPAESAIGLSLCYSEPSYLDLDSSLKFLLIAEEKWAIRSEKSKEKLALYGIDENSVRKQKNVLGDLFFTRWRYGGPATCGRALATSHWNKVT
jgi:hypothetical protein